MAEGPLTAPACRPVRTARRSRRTRPHTMSASQQYRPCQALPAKGSRLYPRIQAGATAGATKDGERRRLLWQSPRRVAATVASGFSLLALWPALPEAEQFVGLQAQPPARVLETIVRGRLRVGRHVRAIHRLQEEMTKL